jgi:hypothetical protein
MQSNIIKRQKLSEDEKVISKLSPKLKMITATIKFNNDITREHDVLYQSELVGKIIRLLNTYSI